MEAFTGPPVHRTPEHKHEECMAWIDAAMKRNYRIRALMDAMEERGCPIRVGLNVLCEPCQVNLYGGFDAVRAEVVICENVVRSAGRVEEVLAHELVHAYDHCRAKVNWNFLPHVACSEIRAAALSGECSLTIGKFAKTALGLKPWRTRMGGVDCARRHAIRSLRTTMPKSNIKDIEKAVDRVFTPCYLDSNPFDAIPPLHRSQYV